jgi:iron complex transport system substrate-binding protein
MRIPAKTFFIPLVFFLADLVVMPCQGMSRAVIDEMGQEIMLPDSPMRVLALAPNLTEIVFMLERGDRLVGATQYSNYPEEARRLPRVGSYVQLDLERIVALRPDLCIASKDGNPRQAIERLAGMNIPVYVVNPQKLEDIQQTVTAIGVLLNAVENAEALVHDMKERLNRIGVAVGKTVMRPRVFFQIDDAPMVSVGSGTFIDELISLAGGTNLAAGQVAYPRFNWEVLLRRQPEVVVITSMAGGRTAAQLQASWRKWPQIPAVAADRLHVVEAELFDRATPRLIKGLEVLAALLHPELTLPEPVNAD